MTFVNAKCTNCGAELKVDSSRDAANCEYCGSAFIVDKAVNNYNIANARISAGTVNVNVGGGDFVIQKGILTEYKGNDREVVIPDTVIKISDRAFIDCITITSVDIPGTVTYIGNGAFADCNNLKTVVIPNSVTYVGNNAFEHCDNLKTVVIPSSVKEIGVELFKDCASLESVTMPGLTRQMADKRGYASPHVFRPFTGCRSLTNITFNSPCDIDFSTDNISAARNSLVFLDRDKDNERPVYINGVNVINNLTGTAKRTSAGDVAGNVAGGGCMVISVIFALFIILCVIAIAMNTVSCLTGNL